MIRVLVNLLHKINLSGKDSIIKLRNYMQQSGKNCFQTIKKTSHVTPEGEQRRLYISPGILLYQVGHLDKRPKEQGVKK